MKSVAEKLRDLRQQISPRLSTERLAQAIGMPRSSYVRYEDPNDFKRDFLPMHLARSIADVFAVHGIPRIEVMKLAGIEDESQMRDEPTNEAASVDMVGIRNTDATFGLGAQFTDAEVEVEVLQFPRVWVETITHTSARLLSWARVRGASMMPTIGDGDLVLIDHSQDDIEDQDLIWAFTIDDTRAIKRLRRKGDRVQIMSDNPSVSVDEEPYDFLNIIGRVVAVIQKQ